MSRRTYRNSEAWEPRARRATPGGAQTGSRAPGRCGPLGGYPMFLSSGNGARVVDVDRNEYIDMIGGLASVAIGHANPEVNEAVMEALNDGCALSLPTRDEAVAAEELCAAIGASYAEQVRFVKTGSESTEAAVRVARVATGRAKVLTVGSGYHSWHSWFQAVKPQHPGVPAELTWLINGFDYGTVPVKQLEREEYAAVILEPLPITGLPEGWGNDDAQHYLRQLVEAAHAHGTLVIFDEVVWGIRKGSGGAGGYFGVEPDLATFGKALGNGLPVGALVGPRRLMEHATLVSGTFGGDRLGLAAMRAVLRIDNGGRVARRLHVLGSAFREAVRAAVPHDSAPYAVEATGDESHPVLRLRLYGVDADAVAMSVLLQGMADEGVLYHPAGGNMMAEMDAADCAKAASAVGLALAELNDAYRRDGAQGVRAALRGEPYVQAMARAR